MACSPPNKPIGWVGQNSAPRCCCIIPCPGRPTYTAIRRKPAFCARKGDSTPRHTLIFPQKPSVKKTTSAIPKPESSGQPGWGWVKETNLDWGFLNPESKIPKNGQIAAGFNWTLGQGLFFDDRRAGLEHGRIGLLKAAAERNAVVNDLLLDAAKAYWNWVLADYQIRIFQDACARRKSGMKACGKATGKETNRL
ncbi:MAG: TolC family protein [Saprospirales bacterium]|nr:TolC family protein [Saprospirales bacterium]